MRAFINEFTSERFQSRLASLPAVGLSMVAIVPALVLLSGTRDVLGGAVIACLIGVVCMSVVLMFATKWKGRTDLPHSLLVWMIVPIMFVSIASLNGETSSRYFLFGTGFEFGTPGFFLLALGAVVSAVMIERRRMYIGAVVIAGLATALVSVWSIFFDTSVSDFARQQAPLVLAAGVVVATIAADRSLAQTRVLLSISALFMLCIFVLLRMPEVALAALIALAAVSGPRFFSDGSGEHRVPIMLAGVALVFLICIVIPPSLRVGFTQLERASIHDSASVISQQYVSSLGAAFIGTGPMSLPHAWNTYRPRSFNQTIWWNRTPDRTWSTATDVATMFGFAGIVAWCLIPLSLFTLVARSREQSGSLVFESALALALFSFVCSLVYPVGASILLGGCVAYGIAVGSAIVSPSRVGSGRTMWVVAFILAGLVFVYVGIFQLMAMYHYARGAALVQRGEFVRAAIPLQKAAFEWPVATYRIGAAQATLGSAIAIAESEKKAGSFDMESFSFLATHALHYAAIAEETDPRNIDTRLSRTALSTILFSAGFVSTSEHEDLAQTISQQLDSIQRQAPTRPDLALNSAIFAKLSGDMGSARANAEVALRLKPDYEAAQLFLESLPAQ